MSKPTIVHLRVELKGSSAERFLEIKDKQGLSQNSETVRFLIKREYDRMSSEGEVEDCPILKSLGDHPNNFGAKSVETLLDLGSALYDAQDCVILCDVEGTILDLNRPATKILRGKKNQLVGRNILDFVSPEDRKKVMENRQKILTQGLKLHSPIKILTNRGTGICEISSILIKDSQGKAVGFVSIAKPMWTGPQS